MKKFSETHPYNYYMYLDLTTLLESHNVYSEVYENLYEVYEVADMFKDLDFLSSGTIDRMYIFQKKWYEYIEKVPYSDDSSFVYLDDNFLSILNNELKLFLGSFNKDLLAAGFNEDIECFDSYVLQYPDNKEVLDSVSMLYKLLVSNGIIASN